MNRAAVNAKPASERMAMANGAAQRVAVRKAVALQRVAALKVAALKVVVRKAVALLKVAVLKAAARKVALQRVVAQRVVGPKTVGLDRRVVNKAVDLAVLVATLVRRCLLPWMPIKMAKSPAKNSPMRSGHCGRWTRTKMAN